MRRYPLILLALLLLAACNSGKNPQYYVLNPICSVVKCKNQYSNLRLGIESIRIPEYLEKQQLAIYYTPHQGRLSDNHLWIERLDSNIKRLVKTNLGLFLPGALVEVSPWEGKFSPNYRLQIAISQFTVDIQGNSTLQASYVIYQDDKLIRHRRVHYCQKLPVVTFETLVVSMNENINRLTRDIAALWRKGI